MNEYADRLSAMGNIRHYIIDRYIFSTEKVHLNFGILAEMQE